MSSLAIFSVDTMTWLPPARLSLKIGPYLSAQDLKVNHEWAGGICRRFPTSGWPGVVTSVRTRELNKDYIKDMNYQIVLSRRTQGGKEQSRDSDFWYFEITVLERK